MPASIIVAGAVCLLVVARAAAHQRRPVRSLLVSALCGVAGLAAVALLNPLTGFSLPLNTFTVGCSVILGLPGVILLLILNVFLSSDTKSKRPC